MQRSQMCLAAVAALAICGVLWSSGTAEAAVSIYGRGLPDVEVEYLDDAESLAPFAKPLVIFGDPFLAPGNLSAGFELPTGAVWQPSLWVFGQGMIYSSAAPSRVT